MLTSWPSVDVAPKILVLPPAAADLGEAEAACELWEHYSGKTLDDDQRIAVYVMMALGPDGRWAASTTGREKARQNGKGDETEVVELWGLVQRAEVILPTVHDAALLATQTQQRMLGVLEGHADLRRRMRRRHVGVGQQMIEMRNGGTVWYRTRTAKGGLGVDDVDRVVLDEAQEAQDAHLAAISPTMLANPNAQLNAVGTAGKKGTSDWWWQQRMRALSSSPGAFGWVGTTAETVYLDGDGRVVQEPVDVEDRKVWLDVSPAVRAGRGGGMAFLEEQFRRLGPELFAREHLCVWDPPPVEAERSWLVWSESEWRACSAAPGPESGWLVGPVALAVEQPPSQELITVTAAGECRDGGVGVEVVAQGRGSAWLVRHLGELRGQGVEFGRVVVDPGGPGLSLIDPLNEAGFPVTEASAKDLMAACGRFHDAVLSQQVRHRDRPEMDAAVQGLTTRDVGGRWLPERRAGVDVSPISTAILAYLGYQLGPVKGAAFPGVVWA